MEADTGGIIKKIVTFTLEHRDKLLYPGIPFIFVPSLLAGLIMHCLTRNPTYYAEDRPAAVEMPVELTGASAGPGNPATLLFVPAAEDFFLRSSGRGIKSVWLSMDPAKVAANSGRLTLTPGGLDLKALHGVPYPLIMVISGEHEGVIDPAGRDSETLGKLELATPLSTWIVFCLLSGAIFGFGASIGFIYDRPVIEEPNTGI
jgi:hypothetical protein